MQKCQTQPHPPLLEGVAKFLAAPIFPSDILAYTAISLWAVQRLLITDPNVVQPVDYED
jgi:hypothetical protein